MRYLTAARVAISLARTAAGRQPGTHEQLRRARRYNREKERLMLISIGLEILASGLFVFSGLGARVRAAVERRLGAGAAGRSAAVAAYALLTWVAVLPLRYYSGFVVEHRYELSNQTHRAWFLDTLKALAIGLALEVPAVDVVYAVIRRRPRTWWAIVSGLSIPVTVLLAQLFPVLIAPLFNKYEPLRDQQLADRLKRLAATSGIRVAEVLQMDMSRQTRKANAFFAGLGRTKRIVLADTLLDSFTPDEIEAVVAHEIAHQAHRDIWRFIAAGTFATFGLSALVDRLARGVLRRRGNLIGAQRLDDIATLPLLAWILSIATLFVSPVQNAYSRLIERRADDFALRLTENPRDFSSAMERLSEVNLADPNPPAVIRYLMYSHPPVRERVEYARRFARERSLPVPEAMQTLES